MIETSWRSMVADPPGSLSQIEVRQLPCRTPAGQPSQQPWPLRAPIDPEPLWQPIPMREPIAHREILPTRAIA